jgi:hypothetical protein
MSYQAVTWVLQNSEAAGVPRLVLLAIASHASPHGHQSHPSTERIAREANCSTRTVFRCIDQLVELGELAYIRNGAPGRGSANYRPNLYWLPGVPGCPGHSDDTGKAIVRGDTTSGLADIPSPDTTSGLEGARGDTTSGPGVTSVQNRGDTAVTQIVPRTVLTTTSLSSTDQVELSASRTGDDDDPIEYPECTVRRARSASVHLGKADSDASPSRRIVVELHAKECADTQWLVNGDELLALAHANPTWNGRRIAAEFRELRIAQALHPSAGPPPSVGPCAHCGHPARHHGRACWTRIADETIADELRAEDERDDEGQG